MIKLRKKIEGFTLVELSVVMVIIGILIGGIVLGGRVVKNAKITKLTVEISQVTKAVSLFKNRYNAMPGDHNGVGSTNVFDNNGSVNSSACSNNTKTSAHPSRNYSVWPAICPGNANGFIESPKHYNDVGNDQPYQNEYIVARNHLVYDGFLPMQYTLRDLPANSTVANLDNKNLKGKFPVSYTGVKAVTWHLDYHQASPDNTVVKKDSNIIIMQNISTQQSFAVDKKMDDGKPLTGVLGKYEFNVGYLDSDNDGNYEEYNDDDDERDTNVFVYVLDK